MKKLLISTLILLCSFPPALAQSGNVATPFTTLGGTITNNVILIADKSPYIVTESVTLLPDATMMIEPGVEVRFEANTNLTIRGNLVAEGMAAKQIVFTSNNTNPHRNDWQGIVIESNPEKNISFKFTTIAYAEKAISGGSGVIILSDAIFHDNNTALSSYGEANIVANQTTFKNNNETVIGHGKTITNSTFRNNTCGLCNTMYITISNSSFTGHEVALLNANGNITSCTITNNKIGIKTRYLDEPFSYNTIADNEIGIISDTYFDNYYELPPIHYNNIYNNSIFNLKEEAPAAIDAKNNYWGTIDPHKINTTIYVPVGTGAVAFDPFFAEPIDITKSSPLPQLISSPLPPPAPPPFPDVSTAHPNFTAIAYLKEHGIVHGHPDGLFRPNDLVNRAESLKMILVSANYDFDQNILQPFKPITATPDFSTTADIDPKPIIFNPSIDYNPRYPDVLTKHWFFPFIIKATDLGIVTGYPNGRFQPENTVNMVEALKMIVLSNETKLPKDITANPYNDVAKDVWFAPYVQYFKNYHLLEPDINNNIHPATYLTRGQLAELIYRFIKREEFKAKYETSTTSTPSTFIFGKATFYGEGDGFDGKGTASGEIFDKNKFTAAHRTLPFGSKIRVWSVENNKSIDVIINDRGPYDYRFVLDLSSAAFEQLAPISRGFIEVKFEIIP